MTPPGFLVFLVKRLLPRACREYVLGDLHERYTSPLGYVRDAASVIPAEIIGQIRKAMPLYYLPIEALLVYASFFAAARLYGDTTRSDPDWIYAFPPQLLCATAAVMAGLLWREAYPQSIFSLRGARRRDGMRLSRLRLRLSAAGALTLTTYFAIYFSCELPSATQDLFFSSTPVFPSIMTKPGGYLLCCLAVVPFRLWIATRRQSFVNHRLKNQN